MKHNRVFHRKALLLGGLALIGVLIACAPFSVVTSLTTSATQAPVSDAAEATSEAEPEATPTPRPPDSVGAVPSPASTVISTDLEAQYEAVYERANPSVVNIQIERAATASDTGTGQLPFSFPNIPGLPTPDQPGTPGTEQTPRVYGQGSGFLYDDVGHIITNYHVAGNADNIRVGFADGLIVDAAFVGGDPYTDIAVIKVDIPASENIEPLALADSSAVNVGQTVVAIGNPFGLDGTMTTGIVSALGRVLPSQAQSAGASFTIPDVIQTDAAINPGNAGGPLLNLAGDVIGINTAIQSEVQQSGGIGFAVPANLIARVVPSLIEKGTYTHPWLGISGHDLLPEFRDAMSLDPAQRGVLMMSIVKDGPADKAGILGSNEEITIGGQSVPVGGDVITAINGVEIVRFEDMLAYIVEQTSIGDTVTLQVLRNGETISLDVTLEARPEAAP
ncbi:MAG: trypsin-like peptidase domain-containing protein [Anaerolineae bacterium]|nr:trypsin-like peptidase domain-containing protein [Anaerolineae bacterium]